MTQTVTTITTLKGSADAGADLGRRVREGFRGERADAVIVFASAQHDYSTLLAALVAECGTDVVVGSSSAGEFTGTTRGEGFVSALALRSPTMRFTTGLGRDVGADPVAAARAACARFQRPELAGFPYRAALVMTDALAGHSDAVVEELTVRTGGSYRFFGGGAGDDGRFQKTHVFVGTDAVTDAVATLEIASMKPLGIGVSHGWLPAGAPLRVTEAEGARVVSLNGAPAVQAFEDHAGATGQHLDVQKPLPFFLHNILGIKGADGFRLRVPLGINGDGSISCAAAVPAGAVVHIMKTSTESAVVAAEQATRAALAALNGAPAQAAIVFDCVATRLRMGAAFDHELKACADLLHPAGFVGCNTYGQIARAEGQFGGFHNCTAVVCAIPA